MGQVYSRNVSVSSRLARLTVEDFGLIARAEIDFSNGLTLFTGETGSGKSMVLGALAFVLGDRASADSVREGCERARVTLEVDPDDALRARTEAAGYPNDAGEAMVIAREVQASGKSSARINGRPATAAEIREFGASIAEIVGQYDQQRLFQPAAHMAMLDRFGGAALVKALEKYSSAYTRHREAAAASAAALAERDASEALLDEAQRTLDDIRALAPKPGEDARLRERREYLRNAERINEALQNAHTLIAADEDSAIAQLGAALRSLRAIERYSDGIARITATFAAMQSQLGDGATELARELEQSPDFTPAELDEIERRVIAIDRIVRRYGTTLDDVFAAQRDAEQRTQAAGTIDTRLTELQAQTRALFGELQTAASALSAARRKSGDRLETAVGRELAGLSMSNAVFSVRLDALEEYTANGAERVEFWLAPNATLAAKPIAKSASGGELSRMLLALTVVTMSAQANSTIVFDEIDAGIGGAVALAVGERLAKLAQTTQVVCVTHLAQIAARGDRHFVLRKVETKKSIIINVEPLATSELLIKELARMLSGRDDAIARGHAEALLSQK